MRHSATLTTGRKSLRALKSSGNRCMRNARIARIPSQGLHTRRGLPRASSGNGTGGDTQPLSRRSRKRGMFPRNTWNRQDDQNGRRKAAFSVVKGRGRAHSPGNAPVSPSARGRPFPRLPAETRPRGRRRDDRGSTARRGRNGTFHLKDGERLGLQGETV